MSESLESTVDRALAAPRNLSVADLARLISCGEGPDAEFVRRAAYGLKVRCSGRKVSMRGIVEIGNVCAKDCYYCGIRKSNSRVERYSLGADAVFDAARRDAQMGYASLVLQGGEIESEANTRFIEECLERIAPLDLGVTLSLGEQEESVYARWKAAGAARYLLRIETSHPLLNPLVFQRSSLIRLKKETNYHVGESAETTS